MTKRKTERSTGRRFTWGIRSTDLPVLQTLLAAEPLASCAECTAGCSDTRIAAHRQHRNAPARTAR